MNRPKPQKLTLRAAWRKADFKPFLVEDEKRNLTRILGMGPAEHFLGWVEGDKDVRSFAPDETVWLWRGKFI